MADLTGKVGFASPATETKSSKRRAGVELLATCALAVCLIIAATAVSIGMAHAQAFGAVKHGSAAPLMLAVIFGPGTLAGAVGLIARPGRECRS
ncbi:MAG: hypothetical protein ACRECE_00745 [Xanthobacteraceae bacterium]